MFQFSTIRTTGECIYFFGKRQYWLSTLLHKISITPFKQLYFTYCMIITKTLLVWIGASWVKHFFCVYLFSVSFELCVFSLFLSLWQPVSFVTFLNLSHLPTLSSSSSLNHLILFMLVFHKYLAGGISKQKQCPHSPNPRLRAEPPPIHKSSGRLSNWLPLFWSSSPQICVDTASAYCRVSDRGLPRLDYNCLKISMSLHKTHDLRRWDVLNQLCRTAIYVWGSQWDFE